MLLGGLLWSAVTGPAVSAQRPQSFGGSLVLEDQRPLTVIDLATGAVTVSLKGIYTAVGATNYASVQAVPLRAGTMLINRTTGSFNLLGEDNYLVDATGAGVGLGRLAGSRAARGFAAGASAYIVRYGPTSTVTLVDEAAVQAGARLEASTPGPATAGPGRTVIPRGFASLGGAVSDQPASTVVSGTDLWTLVQAGARCQVQRLRPVASGHEGLVRATMVTLPGPCATAALAAGAGLVAVITPGHVRLVPGGSAGTGQDVRVPGTNVASSFLPVSGSTGTVWYLARTATGWSVNGVTPAGRITGPAPLLRLGTSSDPVSPVESAGLLYTLDQAASGQPTLWAIGPATGAMTPVSGMPAYPAVSAAEKAGFLGAQVLLAGPRVVFNNPGSLLAVVVFTDGSHAPVIVDKRSAVVVSAAGPALVNVAPTPRSGPNRTGTASNRTRPLPVAASVSQTVTCANTTQKPYVPQITSVVPSSESALVAWSYQLLDQQDCEPDSWSVKMTAVSGSHQPAQPAELVNGQTQLQFTGLRPATTYQTVVTAYINQQSTASTPVSFTTAARGPDPPTAVETRADSRGDWVVSWTPCTAVDCYVAAATWNVVGAACGSAFIGQPPAIAVPAGQTSVTVSAGSLGLLGDSLTFSVQGVLASGLAGNPTADHACTQSWRPPDPAAIILAGQASLTPPPGQSRPRYRCRPGVRRPSPSSAATAPSSSTRSVR